ncbi:MAG TPA: FecR domain-containing protein, partial [Polyangiaceae bacterium]|nr:FecR domain-containing protein [Polyangiaceae bacterium]
SDGTRVELEPRARARVVALSERGAEIVLESGRAHLDVVPSRTPVSGASPWRVSLGPFAVEVKGTRFDVEWDPRTDEFALDLLEGSVRVSGCQEGHSHTLVAGQGVRASCSEKRWTLVAVSEGAARAGAAPVAGEARAGAGATVDAASDARDDAAPEAAATLEGSAPSEAAPDSTRSAGRETSRDAAAGSTRDVARAGARATGPRPLAASRSWQALALGGHYSAAYERALEAGFESECERVGATDLALLGDTARLNGDSGRARVAYLALRRRFEGGAAAAQAAFALGRLAVKSDAATASEWFERSLREAPRGPLAAAAHDWLFELGVAAGDAAQQREVARRYLDGHPEGAHAADAKRLLEGHAPR